MKLVMPKPALRKLITLLLGKAFDDDDIDAFNRGVVKFLRFYDAKCPKILFVDREQMGNSVLGLTTSDGSAILLMSPAVWKKGKKYKSKELWVATAIHELFHAILTNHKEQNVLNAEDDFFRGVMTIPEGKQKKGKKNGKKRPNRS